MVVLNDKIGQCFVNGARARDALWPILFLLEYPGIRIEYEDDGEVVDLINSFARPAAQWLRRNVSGLISGLISGLTSTHLSNPRERPEHTPYTRSPSIRLATGMATGNLPPSSETSHRGWRYMIVADKAMVVSAGTGVSNDTTCFPMPGSSPPWQ